MRVVWAVVAAVALGAGAVAAQQAGLPAPVVQAQDLTRVSPHVQVIPDRGLAGLPNVGFIVGGKAVLVVDTGLGPPNGETVAAVARRIAPGRKIYLVATHAHPEHDLGAQTFPAGTVLIRSSVQAREEAADMRVAAAFAQRGADWAALLKGAVFRPADLTFETRHVLDLGGVSAEIEAMGPAHTPGDTIVWVPADQVLFSGDLAMKLQPSMATPTATLADWRRVLDRQAALAPAIVVPSHGPVGDAGFIEGYRDYLAEVARRTAEAKRAGQDPAQAVETVAAAMADRYPDRARLGGAVRMAWREAGS